jgi:hypothetical protein
MPFLWIETDECSGTCYIRVKYSLDGGSWVTWEDIKDNGVQKLEFPGGVLTQEFNYLQLAFQFITTVATTTPVLEGATIMVMLRPEVLYGYNFEVILARELTTGGFQERRSAAQIKKDLRNLRTSKSPVKLVTPAGEEVWGYISALTETINELNEQEDGFRVDAEYTMQVSFVETLTLRESSAQEN